MDRIVYTLTGFAAGLAVGAVLASLFLLICYWCGVPKKQIKDNLRCAPVPEENYLLNSGSLSCACVRSGRRILIFFLIFLLVPAKLGATIAYTMHTVHTFEQMYQ